jgi:transposase-like protein
MPGRKPKRRVDEMDFHSPQHEAAMFYGLFLKGHSLDSIREEIDISPTTFRKWMKAREYDQRFRADLEQMYQYRKRVLAIFNSLVTSESGYEAWQ